MNSKQKLGLLVFALFIFNTTLPVIVSARLYEKQLPNGITQRVYLFGDRHVWLDFEVEEFREQFKMRDTKEQVQLLEWAKTLNACVLVEDMYEYDEDSGVYYWLTLLPRLILKGALLVGGANTYLAHFSQICKKHDVKVVNIEVRHNITAFSNSICFYFLLNLMNEFVNIIKPRSQYDFEHPSSNLKLQDKLLIAALATSAYGVWHQYASVANGVENSSEKELLKNYWYMFKKIYRMDWLTGRTNAWVDVKALTAILDNPTQKNFFICAGDLHCYNLEVALIQEGYEEKQRDYDPMALWSHLSWVAVESPFDIDDFMKKCTNSVDLG